MICDIQLVLQEDIFQIYCRSQFQAVETIKSIVVTIKAEHSSVKVEHIFVKAEHSFAKAEQRMNRKRMNKAPKHQLKIL